MTKVKLMAFLWFSVPTLCIGGAIFGWILLMEDIKSSGGSTILLVIMYYAFIPVALSAIWLGLHVSEYITSRITGIT